MNRLAIQALQKMETRKFNSKSKGRREGSCGALDTLSSSSTSDCAICLEKYIDGEVRTDAGPVLAGEEVPTTWKDGAPGLTGVAGDILTAARPEKWWPQHGDTLQGAHLYPRHFSSS